MRASDELVACHWLLVALILESSWWRQAQDLVELCLSKVCCVDAVHCTVRVDEGVMMEEAASSQVPLPGCSTGPVHLLQSWRFLAGISKTQPLSRQKIIESKPNKCNNQVSVYIVQILTNFPENLLNKMHMFQFSTVIQMLMCSR